MPVIVEVDDRTLGARNRSFRRNNGRTKHADVGQVQLPHEAIRFALAVWPRPSDASK